MMMTVMVTVMVMVMMVVMVMVMMVMCVTVEHPRSLASAHYLNLLKPLQKVLTYSIQS